MSPHGLTVVAVSENSPEAWIGRVIDDRYRIIELIGEGGMGAVFAAEHLALHRQVAIKIVRPEYAGNAELARRFAREAMVTSAIDHPNVISAIDYGELEDGGAYLTMQLVRGLGIHEILAREGSLHWSRVAQIGAQVADALAAASAEGIVHRDLKPENVLVQVRDDGTDLVKVLDFGIAKFTRDSLAPPPMRGSQTVTQRGVVIGTPGYMAPEQAVGQKADHRADLYSLGVILWECLVGRRMWGGDDAHSIIKNQLRGKPAMPRIVSGDLTIPEEFDELIAQLVSDSPETRPQDAAEVRDRLRALALQGRGIVAAAPARGLMPPVQEPTLRKATTVIESEDEVAARPLIEPRETATPLTGESPAPVEMQQRRSRWPAWAVAALIAGVGALVFTGQIEVTPRGELAEVTEQIAPPRRPEPPATEVGPTGLPLGLEPLLATLIQDETRTGRVDAATRLLGHIPIDEVPSYVRGIAHMQLAETCPEKRDGLSLLQEIRDARALPALVLTSERGKSGCGPKGRRDCLACMRSELDALIGELEVLRREAADEQAKP